MNTNKQKLKLDEVYEDMFYEELKMMGECEMYTDMSYDEWLKTEDGQDWDSEETRNIRLEMMKELRGIE